MAKEGRPAVEHGQAPPGQGDAQRLAAPGGRLVAIGEVLRPQGLRGELRIRLLTDQPDRLAGLGSCVLWDRAGDHRAVARIEHTRRQGDVVVVKLAGVDDPAAARALAGRLLAVDASETLTPAPGHLYPWQLEGCRVETEAGAGVGVVVRVERGRVQDLWVVADGEREHLIPAVPEIVVLVDLGERRAVIRPPDGLLEL